MTDPLEKVMKQETIHGYIYENAEKLAQESGISHTTMTKIAFDWMIARVPKLNNKNK
jgi:hypothetical protein